MNVECYGQPLPAILAPIEAYVRGLRQASASALEAAFDLPSATLVFVNNGQATHSAIAQAIPRWIAGGPMQEGEMASRLLSVNALSPELCVATCEMRLKAVTYRDTLVLALTNGAWKIVSKAFVKVG